MARILVIENDGQVVEAVRSALEPAGHQLLVAPTVADAARAAFEARTDVILLAGGTGPVDGVDALRHLKRAPVQALAEIPVLMLTDSTDEADRVRAGIEGALGVVTKPITAAELAAQVEAVLDGEPEPVKRLRARKEALQRLARIERTRHQQLRQSAGHGGASRPHVLAALPGPEVAALPDRQRQVLAAVSGATTVADAAAQLGISRTSIYANLRRAGRRLGVRSVSELVSRARAGVAA